MRGNVLFGVGLAMVAGVVFVLTVVRQYTAEDAKPPADPGARGGVPLLFTSTDMYPDPRGEDLGRRHFTGIYEANGELVRAPFWFRQPHTDPVTVTVAGRSCSACTSARVAMVSPARTADLARTAAADALARPAGGGLVTALAAAGLVVDLDWKPLDFDRPEAGVTVPAAETQNDPLALGVLQLDVKITAVGPKTVEATVGTRLGDRPAEFQKFKVGAVGVGTFAVDRESVPLGELAEGAGGRDASFNVWSSTRAFDRFPPPAASVNAADGLVEVGAAVPLDAEQMQQVARAVGGPSGPSRVLSAYRIPVTVHRKRPAGAPGDGPAEPEVGPFERQVTVAGPADSTATVRLTGTVSGAVALVGAAAVDLKDFHGDAGVDFKKLEVTSGRADLVLSVDAAATKPGYLKVTLGEPRTEGDRRYWPLRVVVPPGACLGELPRDAAIVLTGTSAAGPVRVRLPVKGRGYRRG